MALFTPHRIRLRTNAVALVTMALLLDACESSERLDNGRIDPPGIPNVALTDLSTDALRRRSYGSRLSIEKELGSQAAGNEYITRYSADGSAAYDTVMASYVSDGLRVYTRIDYPASETPADGHPVVLFLHGWRGIDAAPSLDFYYSVDSYYAQQIDAYVDAGFVVLTPGFRGHGTVDGVPADGIEYMAAFDNGSYLSPVFYAIDVLNLLEAVPQLERIRQATAPGFRIDPDRVSIAGHSQGGDVALIALAVSGEGSPLNVEVSAASIWSGTFPSRFVQLETYEAMQTSPEAFMSGDGSWTGSATGADGTVNPNFVFAYPADWIADVNQDNWTWQRKTWWRPTVRAAMEYKLEQMYATVNRYAADIDGADYKLTAGQDGSVSVTHNPGVARKMSAIGGFHAVEYLTEPLILQHSDRDFYSIPAWNEDLCSRINAAGGQCRNHEYPGNTHSLRISEHRWFSSENAVAGFPAALERDIALFREPQRHTPD